MGRKEDLEKHIHDSYNLIREYEEILRLSSDPKEKTRARRAIEEQRQLIRGWSDEYEQLSGHPLPDHLTEPVGPLDSEEKTVHPEAKERRVESEKPIPKSGYFFLVLLLVDLLVALVLGWQWFGDQPELLAYLQVVTGFLALTLEILLLGIVLQRKMSLDDVLYWLGTSRLWQGIISLVTIVLLGLLFWPQLSQAFEKTNISPTTPSQPATPQESVAQSTASITATVAVLPTSWSPCRIEAFAAEPPSPQPVGGLVIFKIRGTCESGVRAIRLLINDEWYGEKGGHIAPPEEFVPTWSTKNLTPGDYKVMAEVATWGDDDWEFAADQTLTYTLISAPAPTDTASPVVQPWFGPISFCLELDNDNRCLTPTHQLPAGTTRFYASWPFQDVPFETPFRRLWYRDGSLFKRVDDIWDEDWNSPTGVEYTFLDNGESFPNGEYRLELYIEQASEPIQRATVRIGP